jgi:predicted hotdog family 3-hydroxylacyl-ACP dehydratase
MQASSWKVEDLIPHRPPMVLIDRIDSVDLSAGRVEASFIAREEWRGNWFALEYMAQTAAALAGAFDRQGGENDVGRPGLLLGTRKLELGIMEFIPGEEYSVEAVREYVDGDSAAFACTVRPKGASGDAPCCMAVLSAYRPPRIT